MDEIPEAKVVIRRRPSLVWLLPLVAAFIGAWMAVKAYRATGPTITITFLSAEGLEAGQTRLRFKDVDIGRVTAINLSKDLSQVVVTAKLKKEAAGLLSKSTRFWVVRARIGNSGISGLGTLLSGAYIVMDPGPPGAEGPFQLDYKGHESAGLVTSHLPGVLVHLRAEKVGSLNIGSPVRYRQIRVGEVAGFDLDKGGRSISIMVFINAPYDALIHRNTRFWDAGALDVSLDTTGLHVQSDSFVDILLGGIAVENPTSLEDSGPMVPGQMFTLYSNRGSNKEQIFLDRHYYVLNFSESVRGLAQGSPVEYQGIKVGQVEDFRLEFHTGSLEGKIPVLIVLEPERFSVVGGKSSSTERVIEQMVQKGLRAQLKSASLLTGGMFVDLSFHPEAPRRSIGHYGKFPELPTLPSTMGAMLANMASFVERLQKLPLEEVVNQLRAALPALKETLQQAKALLTRLDQETAPQAKETLAQAQATLATLDKTLRSDSPTQQELHKALEEFAKASRSVKELADTLERNPESLIFGKGKQK